MAHTHTEKWRNSGKNALIFLGGWPGEKLLGVAIQRRTTRIWVWLFTSHQVWMAVFLPHKIWFQKIHHWVNIASIAMYIYRDVRIFNVNVSFKATKTYILFNHLTKNTSNKRSHPTPNKNFLKNLHLRNFQQTPGAYPNPPNHQQYYDEGIPESIIWGCFFLGMSKRVLATLSVGMSRGSHHNLHMPLLGGSSHLLTMVTKSHN